MFFLYSCTSTPPTELQPLQGAESYNTETKLTGKSLMLTTKNLQDVEGLSGPLWAPFVLPLENYTQTNASLFMGIFQPNTPGESKDFLSPPEEGECTLLSRSPVLDKKTNKKGEMVLSTQKKLYVFENQTKQKRLNTSLFFILDNESHLPVAVARLNTKGESKCFLPAKPYVISIGYGRYRHERHIDGESRIVGLKFPKVSALRIRSTPNNNIKVGDTIRIGRKFNLGLTEKKNSEFPEIHIASQILPDLYVNADMKSHDFSIDEFLKTSFLVGKSRYQIELEEGNYRVAVLRKSKLLCIDTFKLEADSNHEINCSTTESQSQEEIAYQFNSEDTIFDVGFRPKHLIKESSFVNWTVDTPGTILLGPGKTTKKNNDSSTPVSEDFFSLIFKTNPDSSVEQTNYSASFSEAINVFKLPLKGMSYKSLIFGQVPFSEYVLAKSREYLVPNFLNKTNVMHTNGAEITILEPVQTNQGNLYATSVQDFMIRIFVPKWNSTQILEMYVNDELFKRWILDRTDLSKPFSTTLKTNTYESGNFLVRFTAHGEIPLPNFLTGRDSFLPFVETRVFCVSLDGKDQCS